MGIRSLVTKRWLAMAIEIVNGDWRLGIQDYVRGMDWGFEVILILLMLFL